MPHRPMTNAIRVLVISDNYPNLKRPNQTLRQSHQFYPTMEKTIFSTEIISLSIVE
jgi:hypothetical protein